VIDAPVDYSKYVDVKGYSRTVKKPEGLLLRFPPDEAEALAYDDQLQAYQIGLGTIRQEMPFSTFFVDSKRFYIAEVIGVFTDYGYMRSLYTSRVGQSPAAGKDTSTLPLMLAFHRGTGTSTEGYEYEYATYDELADDGTTVLGGLSLALDGEYGLVAQNFGTMLEYPDYDDFDVRAVLPVGEFYRLRLWKNARIRFYHPNGSVILILKSVDAKISARDDSGYIPVTLKGIIQ
jgi:hypothetical protein